MKTKYKYKMKKIIATVAAVVIALGSAYAQDLAQITEMYNNGAAAISTDKAAALSYFEQALKAAEALGDEGKDVVANCKNIIPSINLSMAKDLVKSASYDEAVAQLNKAVEVAKNYSAEDVAAEAESLVPQVIMQKGNSLLNNKDYAGAAAAYKSITESDPTNGAAYVRLGAALNGAGDSEGAVAAFEKAMENGQEATAKKQLANIYLKNAAADLKTKGYANAVEAALKSYEYGGNAQALQVAGQASQLAGKNNDAIKYFEQYLEAAPNASNAGQIAYTVGALYQTAKNTAKAKEYYQKASTDPKYGAEAKKLLDALK